MAENQEANRKIRIDGMIAYYKRIILMARDHKNSLDFRQIEIYILPLGRKVLSGLARSKCPVGQFRGSEEPGSFGSSPQRC
jgi:hypothetical protein